MSFSVPVCTGPGMPERSAVGHQRRSGALCLTPRSGGNVRAQRFPETCGDVLRRKEKDLSDKIPETWCGQRPDRVVDRTRNCVREPPPAIIDPVRRQSCSHANMSSGVQKPCRPLSCLLQGSRKGSAVVLESVLEPAYTSSARLSSIRCK